MALSGEFVLGFGFTVLGALIGVWARLQVQISENRRDLDAFKLEAAKTYVGAESLLRLEGRLDEGLRGIRDEIRDQNALIINAVSQKPAPRSRARDEHG